MDARSNPIHVIGAGGIGCAVGHALCLAGADVSFIDADSVKVAWGQNHGVGIGSGPLVPARFVHFDDWQPSSDALVLLCTKCYDNAAVLARLPRSANILAIQNGFDPGLEERAGPAEGIASFVSECLPGRTQTRITRRGSLHLGRRGPTANGDGAHERLAGLLRRFGRFRVEVVPDILPYKYTKLMYNAALSPLASAVGVDNGRVLAIARARRLFYELLRENYAILHGAGIPLARIGPFHPDTVQEILRRPFVAHALAWAFYPSLRGTYCSMSGDLPRGTTEIDNYNGHLIALAGDRPCPLNRRVYALVQRMGQERLQPSLAMLDAMEA